LEPAGRRRCQLLRGIRRREQEENEFFATAAPVVKGLEWDLPRIAGRDAALEIGCGPGRLMRPLTAISRKSTGWMYPIP